MKIEEIWNKQETSEIEFSSNQKKSINLVQKIIKRLKLERSTTYLAGPIILAFALVNQVFLMSVIVGLYVIGLILYYNLLLRRIASVDVAVSVKNYLKHTLYVLRWFRLHYLILGFVSFILGFALTNEFFEITLLFNSEWILIILAAMIGTPLITFYIHFHPHLRKIKKIVSGLEEHEV